MAELAAIQQAVRAAAATGHQNVAILTDSKVAIESLRQRQPTKHVALIKTTQAVTEEIQALGRNVTFTWILGHADIRGNTRADALAKNAVLTPFTSLQPPLQRTAINTPA